MRYKFFLLGANKSPTPSSIKIEVLAPRKLMIIMRELYDKISTEFSVYIYGDIEPWPVIKEKHNKVKAVIKDYYFAKQKAHSAYVEMLENAPLKEGMRLLGTIHKHPEGVTSFSSTDHEHTNSKFPLNLLFTKEHIFSYTIFGYPSLFGKKEKKALEKETEPEIVSATVWCVSKRSIADAVIKDMIVGNNELEIKMEKEGSTIFIKADLCETNNVEVKEYGPIPSRKEIEREVEEIISKIEKYEILSKKKKSKKTKKSKKWYDEIDIIIEEEEDENEKDYLYDYYNYDWYYQI